MTAIRLAPITVCVAAAATASCARPTVVPELPQPPEPPPEPLATANTLCFRAYTVDLYRFGDPAFGSRADTSFLILHGWRDSVFATTPGPAWVSLAAHGWGYTAGQWTRYIGDSVAIGFRDSLTYRYTLVMYSEAARGTATARTADGTSLEWPVSLGRMHCSGLRDRPPVPSNKRMDQRARTFQRKAVDCAPGVDTRPFTWKRAWRASRSQVMR